MIYFLYVISAWLFAGLVAWLIKCYLYFRSPDNFVDWVIHICIYNMKENKEEDKIDEFISFMKVNRHSYKRYDLLISMLFGLVAFKSFLDIMSDIKTVTNNGT